ncbi:ERCC4 domain-containing protein [Solidesulfovibrio sp.]
MIIVRDSREQAGYAFDGPRYEGVTVEAGSLSTGDYSVKGLESVIAAERKELGDLIHCLAQDRPRFVRELERARGMDAFMVVVEAPWSDLAAGNYRSRLDPHSACQSVLSFMARHRTPFFFAGSRAAGEYAVWSFLRQYVEGARKRLAAIVKATETAA